MMTLQEFIQQFVPSLSLQLRFLHSLKSEWGIKSDLNLQHTLNAADLDECKDVLAQEIAHEYVRVMQGADENYWNSVKDDELRGIAIQHILDGVVGDLAEVVFGKSKIFSDEE